MNAFHRRSRQGPAMRFLASAVLLLAVAACAAKEECEACSSDDDCAARLVCSSFDDGTRRCGTGTGSTSCPTP
jgi:hypothetical protein